MTDNTEPVNFLKDFVAGRTKASINQLNQAVHSALQQRIEERIEPAIKAAAKYSLMSEYELGNRITREFLPDHGFHAQATINRTRDQFGIKMSSGLPLFYFLLGRLWGRGAGVLDADDRTIIQESGDQSSNLADLIEFLKAYSGKNGLLRGYLLTEDRSEEAPILARYFTYWVETFVIAHELGHIIGNIVPDKVQLKHFERTANKLAKDETTPKDLRQPQIVQSWAREFQADRIGLQIAQDQFELPLRKRNCVNGAIIFFLGATLANFVLRGQPNPCSTSHPSPLSRLRVLLEDFEPLPMQQRNMVHGFRNDILELLETLGCSESLPEVCAGSISGSGFFVLSNYSDNTHDAREQLVHHFNLVFDRNSSYRCLNEDRRMAKKLTEKILNGRHGPALSTLFDQVKAVPDRDWMLRPSVGDIWIDDEPKSLRGCAVPRDPQDTEVFIPYLAYAFSKISLGFDADIVQRDLRVVGGGSKLSVHAQELAGFRSSDRAVGRICSVSFSAIVDVERGQTSARLVLGLPMLATRPNWGGRYQAVVVRQSGPPAKRSNRSLIVDTGGSPSDKHPRGQPYVRQTHMAYFVPERGIVYDWANLTAMHERDGAAVPLDEESISWFMIQLVLLAEFYANRSSGFPRWRLDGVLTRAREEESWNTNLIGAYPTRGEL